MKHAGSRDDLLRRTTAGNPHPPAPPRPWAGQSRASLVLCFFCGLFLVSVVADAPVRDLARSLDPSVVAVLRIVTEFGNSAWSIGIGLALLACVALTSRQRTAILTETLRAFRSTLLLIVGSVALSGILANLAKNVIGRVRPSMGPEVQVFDFAAMTFRAGWASFPSGHATTAAACALALAIALPRLSWAWLAIGLVAALSRAFLGVHWLTDCLAGIALGFIVTLALKRWMERRGHVIHAELRILPQIVVATVLTLARPMPALMRRGLALVRSRGPHRSRHTRQD